MSNPSLKDLPKVALDLKSELEGFNHGCMKKAATAEKNVLPSAEGKFIPRSKICVLTLEQLITLNNKIIRILDFLFFLQLLRGYVYFFQN